MKRRRMMKKLLILSVILALCGSAQAVFLDNFDHASDDNWAAVNYMGWYTNIPDAGRDSPGRTWSIGNWDSFQSLPNPTSFEMSTIAAYNFVNTYTDGQGQAGKLQAWKPGMTGPVANGVLRMIYSGGGWEWTQNDGPFLYKMWTGDFQADVQVVAADNWWHNLGGLMARAPNESYEGANENYVSVSMFPLYNIGNRGQSTVNGVTSSTPGANGHYPSNPYLRLTRVGSLFTMEKSLDGITYTVLGSFNRPDLPAELQVGIMAGNFTRDWMGTMDFDNFSLVPEPATIALLGLGALALIRRKR
jgi:regulation of enolase protein 1 (concanavalin A-like superfamily)